jgi:ribonuclease HII
MSSGVEIGLDESGRGPCFGRLYTAGVIWPTNLDDDKTRALVKDSKKITVSAMKASYEYVVTHAIEWHVDYATVQEVEQYGPLKADMLSLHRCLDLFNAKADHILMDGNYFKPNYKNIKCTTVVKGDALYYSIAAASIIAKYTRDRYIIELCHSYPLLDIYYSLSSNKGYLTKKHQDGIDRYGISDYHRKTYKCCKKKALISLIKKKITPIIKVKPV